MATISAQANTAYNLTSTWVGGVVPVVGDVAALGNFNVTVTDQRRIGLDGATGSVAVTIGASGKLTVANGGELILRGDIEPAGSTGTSDCVHVQAGGKITFEPPTGSRYSIGPAASTSLTRIVRVEGEICTDLSRGGLAGQIVSGSGSGPSVIATSTALFTSLGDGTSSGAAVSVFMNNANHVYDIVGATMVGCGGFHGNISHANVPYRHRKNRHFLSLWDCVAVNCSIALGSFVREICFNVFDRKCGTTNSVASSSVRGVSIDDNLFEDGTEGFGITVAANTWASFKRNLVRKYSDVSASAIGGVCQDQTHNYYVIDGESSGDVHTGNPGTLVSQEYSDNVHETAGGNMFQNNDGWVFGNNSGATLTHTFRRNLLIPAANGRGGNSLFCTFYGASNNNYIVENNTVIAQNYLYQLAGTGSGIQQDRITSWKNNIQWDTAAGTTWFYDASRAVSGAQEDIVSPEGIANNARWNLTETQPAGTGLTNQANGYCGKFSTTPGTTDIEQDPQFLDVTRNLPTFATAYLGATASRGVWSNATTYAVGDTVTRQVSGYYANAVILYRCTVAHDSSASEATDAPGSGTPWRGKWEFATLELIRVALYAGTTYTDATIGVSGGTVIQAMWAWVRKGFTPTNEAFRGAGFGGGDIGAMPMDAIASGGAFSPIGIGLMAEEF